MRTKIELITLWLAMGIVAGLLLSGCVNLDPARESDWRWKQYNHEYRPPYPEDPGLFRSGTF